MPLCIFIIKRGQLIKFSHFFAFLFSLEEEFAVIYHFFEFPCQDCTPLLNLLQGIVVHVACISCWVNQSRLLTKAYLVEQIDPTPTNIRQSLLYLHDMRMFHADNQVCGINHCLRDIMGCTPKFIPSLTGIG